MYDDDIEREAEAQCLADALADRLRAAFTVAGLRPGSIEAYVHDGLLEPLVQVRLDEDETPRLAAALAAASASPAHPRGAGRWQLAAAHCTTCGPLAVTTSRDVIAHHGDTGHHVVERLIAFRHHGAATVVVPDAEHQR